MIAELLVSRLDADWAVSRGREIVSLHSSETAALRDADRWAREAHRAGADARVLVRGPNGRIHIERSYGRHPLVAPGLERAGSALAAP